MKILHWKIQAYDKQEGVTLHGIVVINIQRAVDEAHALELGPKDNSKTFLQAC